MKLIVGLGNPGKEYLNTRHNVGFWAAEKLAEYWGAKKTDWSNSKKAQADYLKITNMADGVEIIKPQTFMNNSGVAVTYAAKKHNLKPAEIIVIHDDKDIKLGEFKIQNGRGSAGHNGIKSIIEHLGTKDFHRVRIGVAPSDDRPMNDTADFVLGKFNKEEKIILEKIWEKIIPEITKILA